MQICKKCGQEMPDEAVYCMMCGKKLTIQKKATKQRGNGQGTVYKAPNGKYVAEVTLYYYLDSNGKRKRQRKTKQFEKKKDAVAALPEMLRSGAAIRPTTLSELHDIFLQSKKYDALSDSQKDKLRYAWNRLQKLHLRDIATLTIDDMQKAIDEQATTFYPAKDMKTILSHCYTLAIQRELVQYNKTQYLELPPLKKTQRDAFHSEEIEKIWQAWNSGKIFAGYVLIMIYAGLRYGEISTIKKDNIFLDKQYAIGGIKTEAGIDREIAFADKIMPIVEYFYNNNSDLLMNIPEQKFYDSYHSLTSELGIRDLPPHCCRHTYFSRLAAENVHEAVITEAGGHKDLSVTMQYIHIPLSEKLAAVNKI
jgi:integrase